MDTRKRKSRAIAAARAAGMDALLVTHLPDVRYLCGFTGSNAAVVLVGGRAVLFTDGRYTAQAQAEAAGTRVLIEKKSALAAACAWVEAAGVKRCGFDAAHTTVATLEAMRKAVSGKLRRGLFQPVGLLVAGLARGKGRGRDCEAVCGGGVGLPVIRGDVGGHYAGDDGGARSGGVGVPGTARWGGGDVVRDDCGEWRTLGAAAWPGDGGKAAEARVCDVWTLAWCSTDT